MVHNDLANYRRTAWHRMLYDASQSRGENKNGESDGRQAGRGDKPESLRPVHVRVWAKDKDCYEKR